MFRIISGPFAGLALAGFLTLFGLFGQIANAQPVIVPAQSGLTLLAPDAVAKFYKLHSSAQVWGESELDQLIEALQGLEQHGLNARHYHLDILQAQKFDVDERDIYATDAWLSAAAHMLYGKLNPISVEPDWTAIGREADLVAELQAVLANGQIGQSLEQFAPKQKGYAALLREYRFLQQQAEEPVRQVMAGPLLRAGMKNERVKALQERLVQLSLFDAEQITGTMGPVTVETVKTFQELNDLNSDGVVGPATLVALNRGMQDKLEKLQINLERWRWLPEDLGRRHLRVNIAGFNVTAWQDGVPVRSHLAIVGKTYRKTPVFSDTIEYLIFNPWWEVPASIARIDKLPLFRQDPSIVQNLGFEVLDGSGQVLESSNIDWNTIRLGTFPYRLRQSPGEQNALGQVKIMFPNVHNVYLHDTPTRGLFAQRQRAFSSGCVRTQDALDLAAWLLEETEGWDQNRIKAAVASGQETRANLSSKVPVHVLYFTAVGEEYGGVRYLDDIYERDAAVLAKLSSVAR